MCVTKLCEKDCVCERLCVCVARWLHMKDCASVCVCDKVVCEKGCV